MRTHTTAILSVVCLGLAISRPGVAAEADAWEYEVTPYLLAAGMDGSVGVKGFTTDVDASFSDILENLDAGFMALFTAQKGPWTFDLEGVYMKLEGDAATTVTGPGGVVSVNGQLDVTNSLYIVQAAVGYRVLDDKTRLDFLGALRWTKLDAKLAVDAATDPPVFDTSNSASGDESWTDFVVGARVLHPVSENVTLVGYADIGAGGSDLTYQLIGGVNWEFKKDFSAKFGYRYLSWDYEDDGTVWDVAASGPYLGLGIRF